MAKKVKEKCQITQTQSRIFARAIYADILAYVETNQDEYRQFLLESECEKNSEIEGSH